MKYVWEKYYKKSKSDTTGNLTLTVMCKPDLSGIKRGVENPCLWKCSSVTCEIFMDMIILDKKLLDLFASHLFDEELWKALWLELLLHVERVNKRLIFVVADVHFGFTLCTSARCGFLLWWHVFFLKNAPLLQSAPSTCVVVIWIRIFAVSAVKNAISLMLSAQQPNHETQNQMHFLATLMQKLCLVNTVYVRYSVSSWLPLARQKVGARRIWTTTSEAIFFLQGLALPIKAYVSQIKYWTNL